MAKIGYMRVSTKEQLLDRQAAQLNEYCDDVHVERLSAVAKVRPVFDYLIASLQPHDTLVVTSLDRAFRSTVDAITQAEALLAREIDFEILNLRVDTKSADEMLSYSVIAAVATHERMRISERTKQGLAEARARGQLLGRPPKLDETELTAIQNKLAAGHGTITEIARQNGMAPWSLSRALKRLATT